MRRLCGWNTAADVPHESTFSRAFAEFAQSELPQLLHRALIAATQSDRLIGHLSRDSTAIEARERFPDALPKPDPKKKKKYKKRPKRAKELPFILVDQRCSVPTHGRHEPASDLSAGGQGWRGTNRRSGPDRL